MKPSQTAIKRLCRIWGILTAALSLISGVCLIAACCYVYGLGKNPFTYENIGAAFSAISVPVFITLGAIVVGLILWALLPAESKKTRAERNPRAVLKRLYATRDLSSLDSEGRSTVRREQRVRRALRITNVITFIFALIYGVIRGAVIPFAEVVNDVKVDYNTLTVNASLRLAACLLPPLILAVVRIFTDERSYGREIAVLQPLARFEASRVEISEQKGTFGRHKGGVLLGTRILLVCVAVVFIVLGIANGGMKDVLEKAIKICTECIGLG